MYRFLFFKKRPLTKKKKNKKQKNKKQKTKKKNKKQPAAPSIFFN